MFTGLVRAVSRVRSADRNPDGLRLVLEAPGSLPEPLPGDSIAVMGCCLTLAEPVQNGNWAFDVIPQTLSATTLGTFEPGKSVNIEPSLRAGDELGGHMVQGHIDGIGHVVGVEEGSDWRIRVRPMPDQIPLMVPRGSVCLDGVSLTIAELDEDAGEFEVALIPTTLHETTLDALSAGDKVNLETDMMARTVFQHMRHFAKHWER